MRFLIPFITLTMRRSKPFSPWDGTRPYQQVPFQYSLHILREPDGVEYYEYLHRDLSNPMLGVIESLRNNIGNEGSILVWYEAFEKTETPRWLKFIQCCSFSE